MSMNLPLLQPGAIVKPRFMLTPDRARQWKNAATNASIGGGIMAGTAMRVDTVSRMPPAVRLELPGRSPPAFITLTGDEIANLFEMTGGASAAQSSPQPQNLAVTFQKLSQKQLAVSSGVAAMREARVALQQDMAAGRFWGNVAVFANAALLPLNVLINAFEMKAAVSLYQAVVKELYGQFARSGTRIEGGKAKTGLSLLKKAANEALKAQGLGKWLPGVNIIVGFAEDSIALFETASMVQEGSAEMRGLLRRLDAKLGEANRAYLDIGIEMDRLLTEMQRRARTA